MTDFFMTTKLIYIHLVEDVYQDHLKKRIREKKINKSDYSLSVPLDVAG